MEFEQAKVSSCYELPRDLFSVFANKQKRLTVSIS